MSFIDTNNVCSIDKQLEIANFYDVKIKLYENLY